MQLEDIKLAIRYLRAHAEKYHLDMDRVVVMGESAGAYFAALTALTGKRREFDKGEYLDQDSSVRGCVTLYTCSSEVHMDSDRLIFPDLTGFIDENTPPFFMVHGTADTTVPYQESVRLHDALNAKGAKADLVLLEGAHHADSPMYQDAMKDRILEFIHSVIG